MERERGADFGPEPRSVRWPTQDRAAFTCSALANDVDIVLPTLTPAGYLFPAPVSSGTRLNPAVGSIRQLTWGDGSNYNSLQICLRQQFRHGFELQGAFTWQKSIDGYSSSVFPTQFQNSTATLFIDRRLNRGVSDFNVGRVAAVSGLWNLPKTSGPRPLLKALANGWQLGGIFTLSDGMPFIPLISGNAAGENSSGSYDVPNRVISPGVHTSRILATRCTTSTSPATLFRCRPIFWGTPDGTHWLAPDLWKWIVRWPVVSICVSFLTPPNFSSGPKRSISRIAQILSRPCRTMRSLIPKVLPSPVLDLSPQPPRLLVKSSSRCGWFGEPWHPSERPN